MSYSKEQRRIDNIKMERPIISIGKVTRLKEGEVKYGLSGEDLIEYIKVNGIIHEKIFKKSLNNPEHNRKYEQKELINRFGFNNSNPGYQIFDSGLIIQWGTVGDGTADDLGTTEAVVFPKPFPNRVFVINANHGEDGLDTSGTYGVGVRNNTLTTTGVTLSTYQLEGIVYWSAIGC